MNKKLKTILIRTGTGIMVFAASLTGAYLLTPNSVRKSVFSQNSGLTPKTNTEESEAGFAYHFSDFVNQLMKDTGIGNTEEGEEKEYYGLQASFENFSISFKKDDVSSFNTIGVDGNLDFMMKGLHDINFNLNVGVDYNHKNVPLEIGYVDQTVYFGIKDLRMKAGSVTINELKGNKDNGVKGLIYQYFIAAKEEGGINFDFDKFINEKYNSLMSGLFSNLDLSNLGSSFKMNGLKDNEEGMGLKVLEKQVENGYEFDLSIQINKKEENTDNINSTEIKLVLDVNEEYRLTKVNLGTIDLGNIVIKGALNFNAVKDLVILPPDNPSFARYDANYNYVEIINYKGWLQKLANFIDEDNQKLGIDFSFDLDSKNGSSTTDIGKIEGSINADFSQLIDITPYLRDGSSQSESQNDSLLTNIRNKATFGLKLDILGQQEQEYSNLTVKYTNGEGYINLNETLNSSNEAVSVIKAKVDTQTINWLIDEMPSMFSNIGGSSSSSALDSLFSFITDSTLVRGIKDGDYSVILDMLKTLENDNDKITIGLDLSTLGLGDNASVDIVLDSRVTDSKKVLNLDINHVEFGSLELNASMKSNGFSDIALGEESSYDSLSFLPTVFDQVKGILDTKQAAFSINGSVLDDKNLGVRISGNGQFDYGDKFGFGDLTIDQYKYENKGIWYSHKIALDVDNKGQNYSLNNAKFIYGDRSSNDNIKGKVTVQSVLDIVDVIKTFIDDSKDDERFTKFLEPIMRAMSMGEIGEIINSKDYFRLLKNDLVKSAKRNGNYLDLTIGGQLFTLDSDIVIRVTLNEDKLQSLDIINLGLSGGKKLNLTLSLEDYDASKVSPVDTSASFMDFSSIALLLKFGINTTKNNYYHLTANIDLNAILVFNMDFQLDVYIVVNNSYVKIYGVINDAKLSTIAQDYIPLYTESIKSEFTFETYDENDPNRLDGVGGYFHFKTTKETWFTTDVRHYKTTSKNLLEEDNILEYLMCDFLLVRKDLLSSIGNLSLSNDAEEKEPGEFTNLFTDTGFQYTESSKKWDVGINLNEITGIDALRDLELSIYGSQYDNLSKLVAKLNVKASLVTIHLGATITLENPNPAITDWSSNIQNAFDAINNVVFPEAKLNNPSSYLEY